MSLEVDAGRRVGDLKEVAEPAVRHLRNAARLFDEASRPSTSEEKSLRDELEAAMATPTKLGTPERTIPAVGASKCVSDFTRCPEGDSGL